MAPKSTPVSKWETLTPLLVALRKLVGRPERGELLVSAMRFLCDVGIRLGRADGNGTGSTSDELACNHSTRWCGLGRILQVLPRPNMRGVVGSRRTYEDTEFTKRDVVIPEARGVVATTAIEHVRAVIGADEGRDDDLG